MFRKLISLKALPWIGLLAGVALLAWVLRDFAFMRFWNVVLTAEPWPLAALPAAIIVETAVRAEKWRHLLAPLATVARHRLFGSIMAGHFVNMIAPVHIGPLVRAWLLARLQRMPTGSLLATVALDRTTDGLAFAGFAVLALVMLRFPEQDGQIRLGFMWGTAASLAALSLVVAVFVGLRRGKLSRLAALLSARPFAILPARWRDFIAGFARSFAAGVVWPRETWRSVVIVAATMLIKIIAVSYFVWASLAFGAVLGGADYLFLMVFLGFLIFLSGMLKVVGGVTAGGVFALGLLGVEVETALAMTLAVQATTHATVAVAGAASLWAQGVSPTVLREMRDDRAGAD